MIGRISYTFCQPSWKYPFWIHQEIGMPPTSAIPEVPAPIFGRRLEQTSARTYWKCEIGRRIHLARDRARQYAPDKGGRFTREGFARTIGISAQRLWEIENGVLAIDGAEIALVAEALGIHPGELFYDPDHRSQDQGAKAPAWLVTKSIEDLAESDRSLLECLVVRLNAGEDAGRMPANAAPATGHYEKARPCRPGLSTSIAN
jgi:transcriptional regulator with XRE-family HTH domain